MKTSMRALLNSLIGLLFCISATVGQTPPEPAGRTPQADYVVTEPDSPISSVDAIGSREEFDAIARTYHQNTPYSLPHAMFVIDRREDNKIYYVNSRRFRFHKDFLLATYLVPRGADVHKPIYLDEDRRFIVGTIAWQTPVERFTWEVWEGDLATREHIKTAHEAINKTFFAEVAYKPNSLRQEDVSADLGLDRVLQSDILKNQEYLALNPGRAVGRIHIIEKLDDTVEIGDNEILVLNELPLSLPPVRGIILSKPSSPLSHVNILAKGWGIPNVYIKDAHKLFKDKHTFVWDFEATMTEYKFHPVDFETIREKFDSPDQQIPPADLTVKRLTPLRQQRKADSVAFGAKAANLGEIINARVPGIIVPDGFSVPYYWYDKFMKDNGLDKVVDKLLDDYDFIHNPRYRREKLQELRDAIQKGRFDPTLRRQVIQQWRTQLGFRPVFVRSSSNAEDLPNFSGAGLYSSAANVRTSANLIEGIKRVWGSLWNFDAYEARVRNYVSQEDVYMSTLIQVGVDMQKGGVLITRDPFNPADSDSIYISAVCGHNSKVVSNRGMPEQVLYVPTSDSVSVMTRSDQTSALRFAAAGDLRSTADDCANAQGRVLSDAEIRSIASAARKIHDVFNSGAQDIEWGIMNGRLYVVQSRPYFER
ncbi:MAG TPA: PEP/pyruvate-binding domain-containing protein [Pyrinomonadaceae bacterium]|nr:PEP/pyruvate-binding domain-containing protein [Pyrinomonadaceae bacterium]HMP66515.1 PEP/pyruvate-binding domain-containing protein [Pyrinomonadaceae bacterium]